MHCPQSMALQRAGDTAERPPPQLCSRQACVAPQRWGSMQGRGFCWAAANAARLAAPKRRALAEVQPRPRQADLLGHRLCAPFSPTPMPSHLGHGPEPVKKQRNAHAGGRPRLHTSSTKRVCSGPWYVWTPGCSSVFSIDLARGGSGPLASHPGATHARVSSRTHTQRSSSVSCRIHARRGLGQNTHAAVLFRLIQAPQCKTLCSLTRAVVPAAAGPLQLSSCEESLPAPAQGSPARANQCRPCSMHAPLQGTCPHLHRAMRGHAYACIGNAVWACVRA